MISFVLKITTMSEIWFINWNSSGQYENNGMFFLSQGQMFSVSILPFSLDHDTLIIVNR